MCVHAVQQQKKKTSAEMSSALLHQGEELAFLLYF